MRISSGYNAHVKKQEEKPAKAGKELAGRARAPQPEDKPPEAEGALFEYAERHALLKGYGKYGQRISYRTPPWQDDRAEKAPEAEAIVAGEVAEREEGADSATDEKYGDIKQALEMLRERQVSSGNTQNIKDIAGALTRRLVVAKSTMEVHQVAADALKELGELRMIAASATGDDAKKAWAVIKKLEKVVKRCNRKIGDLDKEDTMRRQQKRAEKAEMEQRAKEIARELKAKILRRKQREKKYLREIEEENQKNVGATQPNEEAAQLSAVEEAHIEARAMAQAAMEFGETAATASGGGETAGGGEAQAGALAGARGGGRLEGGGGEASVAGASGAESDA